MIPMEKNPSVATDDESNARKIIREVMARDDDTRSALQGHRLIFLGHGNSSTVFSAGRSLVVKLTWSDIDCRYAARLYGRGKVDGWPEVKAMVNVKFSDRDRACILVAERCRTSHDLSVARAQKLDEAVVAVETWFAYSGRVPIEKVELWGDLSPQQRRWAKQLMSGLVEIGRMKDEPTVELDTYSENYGLDAQGNAVWIDFGI